MVHVQTADRASEPELKELARVRTLDVLKQGEASVPKYSLGTIVHVYPGGQAFEVEFSAPPGAVLTARRDQLEPE